jgi:5-formyltetrahydrofolate cyclo-ligase
MDNYKEKEKKLDDVLEKLNSMSVEVAKINKNINSLNTEKNQLLSEKAESDKKFQNLAIQHDELKLELEKINQDVNLKFGKKNDFNQKIDELNQETEILIDEIEKWQT